jgi:hypothetical protein
VHILFLLFRAYTLLVGLSFLLFLLRRLGWGGGRVEPYVLSRAVLGEMAYIVLFGRDVLSVICRFRRTDILSLSRILRLRDGACFFLRAYI